MIFTVDIRGSEVLLALRNGAKRQTYAIANAINTTLLAIQVSVPAHLQRKGFVIRKRSFFFGRGGQHGGVANKINKNDFANSKLNRLRGRVWVEASSVSSQRRLILPLFETGGTRQPMTSGAKHVAVPILGRPARPSIAQGVPPEFTFAALRLQAYSGGKKLRRKARGGHVRDVSTFGEYGRLRLPDQDSALQWKGRQRTFLLPKLKDGRPGGVFQRFGRGKDGVRLLYAFILPPQLDARLGYVQNAQAVADRVFVPALMAEVRKTLEFHHAERAAA